MRKHIVLLLAFCIYTVFAQAQILNPTHWTFRPAQLQAQVGEEIELIFNAKIDNNWYLYSSDFDPNLGPIVTSFRFKANDAYQIIGKPRPVGAKRKYDAIWGGEISYFTKTAEFRQKIKATKTGILKIEGTFEAQACTETDGKCVPVDGAFVFDNINILASKETVISNPSSAPSLQHKQTTTTPAPQLSADTHAPANALKPVLTDSSHAADIQTQADTIGLSPTQSKDVTVVVNDTYQSSSVLGFMLASFLAGLLALLTPCVFPMIPMTVTFFTRKGGTHSRGVFMALVFGLSIIAIYTLIGTLVARINGPEFANFLSTHWFPNLLFFAIFILFALSFLGMYDITLPSKWVNKADEQAEKGGYYGVFFMAFTLALVSFSCTGPIVGSILVASAGGAIIKPIAGMFGFSLAFAIPFTLFAIFPSWLSNLPKSGGWLNAVKVVLGFLELALALKFLSIADQAYHWNLLSREINLALWIVIFAMIGFYLLGKIRLPHDTELSHVSVPRILLSICSFSFVVYLIPGLFGAPLTALSGYLPPQTTTGFNLSAPQSVNTGKQPLCDEPKYSSFMHLQHGLQGYFDYQQGLACARQQNKPLFIDFTGHGCVNCREMEAKVWSDPRVLAILQNDYVIVSLYVDDKTELPESDWYTSKYDGKLKTTIGKQNADLQVSRFHANAQPYYVLLGNDESLLAQPHAYDLNADNFVAFLKEGLINFKQRENG